MPIGLNDGMAPKVRTALALYGLGASGMQPALQLVLTQKLTKGH